MGKSIQTSVGNGVAVLSLRQGFSLDATQRAELVSALKAALQNPEIDGVVLAGEAGALASDIPLEERLEGEAAPSLSAVCEAINSADKPVVAALRGFVRDAGLELVLCARARVAQQSARIRLTRLQSGRLPTAAALTTLAKALSPRAGTAFLQSTEGRPVSHAALAPLFDEIVSQNAVGQAADLARALAPLPATPTVAGTQDPLGYQADIEHLRTQRAPSPEQAALVEVFEAAQLLPDEALSGFINDRDKSLAQSTETRAKTYEQACREALLRSESESPPIARLGLVGTGPQARSLCLAALRKGLHVDVMSPDADSWASFQNALAGAFKQLVERGALGAHQAQNAIAKLSAVDEPDDLCECDYVVEAGAQSVEQIAALAENLRTALPATTPLLLTTGMRHGAGRFKHLLSSNTAAAHLHTNGALIEFVEIALENDAFSADRQRTIFSAPLRQLGLPTVVQKARDGMASARLLTAYLQGAEECYARGASANDVEQALGALVSPLRFQDAEGFRLQPFRISTFFVSDDDSAIAPSLSGALLRAGFVGRGKASLFDEHGAMLPEGQAALKAWRTSVQQDWQVKAQSLTAGEIVQIIDGALYCVAAECLGSGHATTPWSLDYVAAKTLRAAPGFGGPFQRAQAQGLLSMQRFLQAYQPLREAFYSPPDNLAEMIKHGAHYLQPYQVGSTRF